MGLDCSHDAWHGPYSTFNQWRVAVAAAAGMPPLALMEGFHLLRKGLPEPYLSQSAIQWETLVPDELHVLLSHSDCDGHIDSRLCAHIAARLEALLPALGEWQSETRQFIAGLRAAAAAREDLQFH